MRKRPNEEWRGKGWGVRPKKKIREAPTDNFVPALDDSFVLASSSVV